MSLQKGYKVFIGWKIDQEDELFSTITEEFIEEFIEENDEHFLEISRDVYNDYIYLGKQLCFELEDGEDKEYSIDLEHLHKEFKYLESAIQDLELNLQEPKLFTFTYWQ
jgi:hypothetical protein